MMGIFGRSRGGTDIGIAPARDDDRSGIDRLPTSRPVPAVDLEVPDVIETATFALG